MVEEPQEINNLFKGDYSISSPDIDVELQQQQQQQQKKSVSPVAEKSNVNNRRLTTRQQSFTRGTASSMAKVARAEKPPVEGATLAKRRLSVRPRKASLTPSVIDNNRMLTMGSTSPTQIMTQRRSSWSPFTQQHASNATTVPAPSSNNRNENKLPSSPSPSPPPPTASPAVNMDVPSSKPIVCHRDTEVVTPPPQDRSVVNASNNNKENFSSESNNNRTMSVTDNSTVLKRPNKSVSGGVVLIDDAASAAEALQQHTNPLETTSSLAPDIVADEVLNIRSVPSRSSSIETQNHHHHYHHHHHHSSGEDDQLPGYMRRPICAACNRNVKVTSSSESTAGQQHPHHKSSSTSTNATSKNSSRRSSFSKRSSSGDLHTKYANNKRIVTSRMKHPKSEDDEDNETKNTVIVMTPTSTLSITSASSSAPEGEPQHQQKLKQQYPGTLPHHRVSLRSNSPTSPIPTRRKKKLSTKKEDSSSTQQQLKKQEQQTSDSLIQIQSMDKWSQLLTQQQLLLTILLSNQDNADDDVELNTIQTNITKLGTTLHQGQYETILLETQAKILQKLTLLMMHQQQQRHALLCLSSAADTNATTTTMVTPRTIYNQQQDNIYYEQEEEDEEEESPLEITGWQTKLEYGIARFKWNMSHWIGNMVGTGDIEAQDFDSLGYPKNMVVSGVCVTTEPGLLPKGLQKYYKPGHEIDQVICHKYMIRLTRDLRLTQFQLISQEEWKHDTEVHQCEFAFRDQGKTRRCQTDFGVFQRRHHCRSCGHVFCQTHSSNRLPLFISSGQERGEWARVCDSCFYARVESQFLARS